MTSVMSVLGPVATGDLGVVDAHDHIVIHPGVGPAADPDLHLDDEQESLTEVEAFSAAGGVTVVDAMPTACGRDAERLQRISRATGVTVIATAGFHRPEYYPPQHWVRRYSHEHQVDLLTAEVEEGIDRYDYSGPLVERTTVRPGLLKVATSHNRISALERSMLAVAAGVWDRTRLPVLTHTESGTYAHEQLDLLEEHGVPAAVVALSHMDRNPDPGLHASLAERGAFLVYDGVGRERQRSVSMVAAALASVAERGHADQLLLGGDVARRSLRRACGGSGIAGLLSAHVPALHRAGVDRSLLDRCLTVNPAEWLGSPNLEQR